MLGKAAVYLATVSLQSKGNDETLTRQKHRGPEQLGKTRTLSLLTLGGRDDSRRSMLHWSDRLLRGGCLLSKLIAQTTG